MWPLPHAPCPPIPLCIAPVGALDFAGSAVVHMLGGIASLIWATLLGPRKDRFRKDNKGKVVAIETGGAMYFEARNYSSQTIGIFLLWIGW